MQSWGLTDPGCVRKQNQDSYRIEQLDRGNLLCIVCDGMGGAKSGNIASSLAVDVFVEEVRRCWKPVMEQDKVDQMLRSAVKLANFTVYDQSRQFEEFDGMGTTLVAVMVRGRKATVVNVGDSRAYLIRPDGIRRITRDHSVVEDLIANGDLTPEQARRHPQKNLITRALGTSPRVKADLFQETVAPGDALLLCSDGLINEVTDQEIQKEVLAGGSPQEICQRLVARTLDHGAPDNVTVVLFQL